MRLVNVIKSVYLLAISVTACVTPKTDVNEFQVVALEPSDFDRSFSDKDKIEFFKKFIPDKRTIADSPRNECPAEPKIEPIAYNKLITRLHITFKSVSAMCTGFFVGPKIIATAAHCLTHFSRNSPPEAATSAYVSAGFYIDTNGIPKDFGGDSAYRILRNLKYKESNPGSVSLKEAAEDYAFLVLRKASLYQGLGVNTSHKLVQPDFRITTTPPISGGDPVVVNEGKNYEVIGYPNIDDNSETQETMLRTAESKLYPQNDGKVAGSRFRVYPGNSGGPIREANKSINVTGIMSSGLCGNQSAVPHAEMLDALATAEKLSSCLQTAENPCLTACCDGIVSPTSDVTRCKNSCIIE